MTVHHVPGQEKAQKLFRRRHHRVLRTACCSLHCLSEILYSSDWIYLPCRAFGKVNSPAGMSIDKLQDQYHVTSPNSFRITCHIYHGETRSFWHHLQSAPSGISRLIRRDYIYMIQSCVLWHATHQYQQPRQYSRLRFFFQRRSSILFKETSPTNSIFKHSVILQGQPTIWNLVNPIIMKPTLFFLCAIVCTLQQQRTEAGIEKCLRLSNPSANGRRVSIGFFVNRSLRDFYNEGGVCSRIVHTDSIRIHGKCNNFNVHKDDTALFKRCKRRKLVNGELFRTCYWNTRTTSRGGLLETFPLAVGDRVLVQIFDRRDCRDAMASAFVRVRRRTGWHCCRYVLRTRTICLETNGRPRATMNAAIEGLYLVSWVFLNTGVRFRYLYWW